MKDDRKREKETEGAMGESVRLPLAAASTRLFARFYEFLMGLQGWKFRLPAISKRGGEYRK